MRPGPRTRRAVPTAIVVAFALLLVATAPLAAAPPDGKGGGKPGAGGGGKPGYPDRIVWGGIEWQVKTSNAPVGPGPCLFSSDNVEVDAQDRLHLTVRQIASTWTCGEIIGPTTHGYGTYTFTLASDVSALDPNVVLGLFTWSDRAQQNNREIDIEFARWGDASNTTNAQYVVQPWDRPGQLHRFVQPALERSVHSFTWRQGSLTWSSRRATGELIATYAFTGSAVPTTRDERVRLNLWLFGGNPPTNSQPVTVTIESFDFTP